MADQADVERWSKLIATGYANDCVPLVTPLDALDLAGYLNDALASCIMLAIPPKDWGPDYVNPALGRWEAMTRRRRGKRLGAVDYGQGKITME